jgi:hypothetical protein
LTLLLSQVNTEAEVLIAKMAKAVVEAWGGMTPAK